ncbi:MAG: MBL fold metallo-hydrolase [Dehalococcoidia bacterium]
MLNTNFADEVRVQIVDDNSVDFLLAREGNWDRYDLPTQFAFKQRPVQAEFGISFLVEVVRGGRTSSVLFDAGFTGPVLLHNLDTLAVDIGTLDHVVISHGHPDHYGGLEALLTRFDRPLPVATHPTAFEPRYAIMPSGAVAPFYNAHFNRERLSAQGASFTLSRSPVPIAPGVYTTGEIPRQTSFEGPREGKTFAGLYQVNEGVCGLDQVIDEIALVINVRDAGLIVLTGCGHAGVVNSIAQAQAITGVKTVLAVMGGFHLGFPGTPEENVQLTVEAFREIGVQQVVPMHCTGLKAVSAIAAGLPNAFVQPSVGTTFSYQAGQAKVSSNGAASVGSIREPERAVR